MSKLRRLLVAALLLLVLPAGRAGPPLEEIIRESYPVPAGVALTIRNGDGTVHIYGSSEDVITMVAIKKAYTQERLDGIKVSVTVDGGTALIDTAFPAKPEGLSLGDRSGTVDYILVVPQTCAIELVNEASGDVVLEGIRGAGVNARLTNGRILIRNCFSPLQLKVERGALDVFFGWWETDRPLSISGETNNGDIRVALPPDAAASLDLETSNGWIHNQFGEKQEPENDAKTWQTAIGEQPTAEIKLRANDGNIRIEHAY